MFEDLVQVKGRADDAADGGDHLILMGQLPRRFLALLQGILRCLPVGDVATIYLTDAKVWFAPENEMKIPVTHLGRMRHDQAPLNTLLQVQGCRAGQQRYQRHPLVRPLSQNGDGGRVGGKDQAVGIKAQHGSRVQLGKEGQLPDTVLQLALGPLALGDVFHGTHIAGQLAFRGEQTPAPLGNPKYCSLSRRQLVLGRELTVIRDRLGPRFEHPFPVIRMSHLAPVACQALFKG